ncbi:MAG: energy transducer TonB [Rhodospirillales bacterium]|nr:energy transducer TonB [Rhodospirillales bacterium]MBO6785711.1 energy transducer TonB [Rhodospirillales bacterium]
MNIKRRHWLAASLVAFAAHGALILLLWEPSKSGAADLGKGGMEVSFGMAGGAPGAVDVPPPVARAVEVLETQTFEPAETDPVDPIEAAEPVPPLEVAAIDPSVDGTVPVTEVEPRAETAQVPRKPQPPREVEPARPEPSPEVSTERTVEPRPEQEVAARTATQPREETAAEPSNEPRSAAGSGGNSGTEKFANTGSGSTASAGGMPGSAKGYFARLQAWLERHKEYPVSARRRRREGMAVLNFTMSSDGEVLAARILRGTGVAALDEEVMRMIRRAAPLPAFPDDFDQSRLTLSVPVRFQLH